MIAFSRKLLAGLVAIAVIASALTGLIMTGTAAAQTPACPLDEDFSSWLPGGWATDDWYQSYTKHAEGSSPEARLYYSNITGDYAYLDSKPVDTTGASSLTLEFKSFIDDYAGYMTLSYDCRVYTRANGGDGWTDVTPWGNPIWGNVDPASYSIDISPDIGSGTQVRFEFDGYFWDIDYWYVDDVKICRAGAISTLPTHLRYLHAEAGLINITDPTGTEWHELWPFFCHEYHLSSWNDTGGNGVLSRCDWIDMYEKPDGAVKPYHVEEVTITLNVTPARNHVVDDLFLPLEAPLGGAQQSMFIELEGGYDPAVLTAPNSTRWHEVYPDFCQEYQLIAWNDTGNPPSELGYCDYVLLRPQGPYDPLPCPLDEGFSSWLPGGWDTDYWKQWDTNYAGGTSPEALLFWAWISDGYAHLDSGPVDTSGASSLTLEFKSFIDDYYGWLLYSYTCKVYTRAHGGDGWTDVTPWSNPISGNVTASTYSIDISPDIGSATQVRFEFSGEASDMDNWHVDDVSICYIFDPEPTWWHVEEVATDIAVSREPPPVGGEAYPVSKASLLAPWLAAAAAVASGAGVLVLKRRRT